ncbi:hypothetical protein [Dyella sp.]|uniref:hypothetical protein n=1 Tax=Dyella sp. TaxID=1869338 RepID=UPI002D7729B4|nr:hypothetical protein [Dyella sp.]HET6433102.1 hypothetical protein [Dyella sp.]
MPKQPIKHGTGDRNNNDVARKDAKIHERRDRENERSDEHRDRADEHRTGNDEPPSDGARLP